MEMQLNNRLDSKPRKELKRTKSVQKGIHIIIKQINPEHKALNP
jgi:hypothetical protein